MCLRHYNGRSVSMQGGEETAAARDVIAEQEDARTKEEEAASGTGVRRSVW